MTDSTTIASEAMDEGDSRRGGRAEAVTWLRQGDNGSAQRGDWVGAARKLGQVSTTRRLGAQLHVRGVA